MGASLEEHSETANIYIKKKEKRKSRSVERKSLFFFFLVFFLAFFVKSTQICATFKCMAFVTV